MKVMSCAAPNQDKRRSLDYFRDKNFNYRTVQVSGVRERGENFISNLFRANLLLV